MTTPIATRTFDTLDGMIAALQEMRDALVMERPGLATDDVYVLHAVSGDPIERVTLMRNTLTDGTLVYDVEVK